MQVTAELQQIPVGFHQLRAVAALHQMSPALMPPVEPDNVTGLKVLHEGAQIGVRCFHHQMGMVVHQAIEVQNHSVPQDAGAQSLHKTDTIVVIPHDGLAFVAPQGDVVESSLILNAQGRAIATL